MHANLDSRYGHARNLCRLCNGEAFDFCVQDRQTQTFRLLLKQNQNIAMRLLGRVIGGVKKIRVAVQ